MCSERRPFIATLVLAATALLAGCVTPPQMPRCNADELAYVGTDGTGLRALRFDSCAGRLASLGVVADVAKPRWTTPHPRLPVLYAALDSGRVAAFAVDRASGALTVLNEAPAGGAGTTHLLLDAPSQTLLAANFGAGSVSTLAVQPDGRVGPAISTRQASGSGPHRRQASPHAHGSAVDPGGRYVLVPDLGADRVFVYGLNRATRTLAADDAGRSLVVPPGSGPRRALFGRDGRFAYVLNELSAELMVLAWDGAQGRLTPQQTLAVSTPGFQGVRSVSEMLLSADGRFLYVGNRGEHLLTVYRVDAASGALTLAQRLPSGGEGLWAFDLHASGRWLLVAHYRSNRVQLFAVDPLTGQLTDTGRTVESPAPVSVGFMP